MVRAGEGNTRPLPEYGDFLEDEIKERLERIDGISTVNVFGGVSRELQIVINPDELARFNMTIPRSWQPAVGEHQRLGRRGRRGQAPLRRARRWQARHHRGDRRRGAAQRGQGNAGIARPGAGSDVAEVGFAYKENTAQLRFRGEPALAFNLCANRAPT
jgi:HAE1 family hydrophobic/amphiphilic exporter-1